MKSKILPCLICLLCSINAYALNIVDINGIDGPRAERILKQYRNKIAAIEQKIIEEFVNTGKEGDEKRFNTIIAERMRLIDKIKRDNRLLSVDFQTISYPDKQLACTTIEVVTPDQPERLKYINFRQAAAQKKPTGDVIDKMDEYSNKSLLLFLNHQLVMGEPQCPYYYCGLGFDHPDLQGYAPLFKKAVTRQKQLILATLNHDKDPARRAAATFLVGFFPHPREIINILLPHVNDADNGVRNNVILVIAGVMQAAHVYEIHLEPFVALLNSPYTTDRNKSLMVLMEAVKAPKSRHYLLHHAKSQLVALLKLKQLNNHEPAYYLLKKISGKDFGEKNINAWEKWRDSE